MIDKSSEGKMSSRHGIARFGDGLSETITPILDAISAAGWELAFHPISGIHDGWLFRTTSRSAKDPQTIADRVMTEWIVRKQERAVFIFPPMDE